MKIAVRLDDITPDMDWKKFLKFKELLDLYEIKPLIGVVPDNRDECLKMDSEKENFFEYIQELQKEGWVIAMHGWRHVYDSKKGGMFPLNHFSEFAGHSFSEQEKRIREGKTLLEQSGLYTDIFMAPAHSYDENTLKALKMNGFTKITDGFGKHPYRWDELCFYPISFKLSKSLKKADGYSTMVVHTNTIENMEYYQRLFEIHHDKFINYSEYLKLEVRTQNIWNRWGESILANIKCILVKIMQ